MADIESNVQEVLNNLTNSMKRDNIDNMEAFSSVIAQHNAAQAAAQAAAATENKTLPPSVDQSHFDQHHADQDPLQRLAQQIQDQQKEDKDQSNPLPTVHLAESSDSGSTLATVPITPSPVSPPTTKPAAGSEEWHRLRRDNHKEVERRRRETINEGINDLAKVVPNCEKNKGAILRQVVKYIQDLQQDNERLATEASTAHAIKNEMDQMALVRSVTEEALQSLSAQHAQLKRDYAKLEEEVNARKKQRGDE